MNGKTTSWNYTWEAPSTCSGSVTFRALCGAGGSVRHTASLSLDNFRRQNQPGCRYTYIQSRIGFNILFSSFVQQPGGSIGTIALIVIAES